MWHLLCEIAPLLFSLKMNMNALLHKCLQLLYDVNGGALQAPLKNLFTFHAQVVAGLHPDS